jgi:glutamyl/glutaminyl-tRNA synthetase
MSTISGLRRRGYTAASLRNFANTIGIAKRDNLIDVSVLEFCIREDLNKTAPRVMAVLDPVKLVITNYPERQEEWLDAENNQEDETPVSGRYLFHAKSILNAKTLWRKRLRSFSASVSGKKCASKMPIIKENR